MARMQVTADLSLDVVDEGQGELVLLIAGGFMDMDQWAPVAERLAESCRAVRYDQRGIGASDQTTEGYTIEQFAEDAIGLIEGLGGGPATLVGNSLGGSVAMAAAFAAPELVNGLVLCATSSGPQGPPTPVETMQRMMRGASLPVPQAASAMMDILFATDYIDEHPAMLDAAIEKRSQGSPMMATLGPLQSALVFDPLERLAEIGLPLLVLHGEEDVVVLPEHGERLASVGGGELRLVADAGHALVVEREELAARAILGWLGE